MEKYKVIVSEIADTEIDKQYNYICGYADTIDVADNWYEQALSEIADLAYIHGFSEYEFIKKFKAYKKFFGKGKHFQFVIIYTVNDEEKKINVIHCLNCKQEEVTNNLILNHYGQRLEHTVNRHIAFNRYGRRKVLCNSGKQW